MASGSRQIQSQVQKLSPQQILQANIMQLTNSLLEQRIVKELEDNPTLEIVCLLYTSPSPRDRTRSRMPSSA